MAEQLKKAKAPNMSKSLVGLGVFALVFLMALVLAANNNTVLGWVIAVIALAWLLLAAFVVFNVWRVAAIGMAGISTATSAFNTMSGARRQEADLSATASVSDSTAERDEKVTHCLRIVQIQAGEIRRLREEGDDEGVTRALDTIAQTAQMAQRMIRPPSQTDEPLTGKVVE